MICELRCMTYMIYRWGNGDLTCIGFVPWPRLEHFGFGIRTRVWPVLKGRMARRNKSCASVTLLWRPSWVAWHTQSRTGTSDTYPEWTIWLSRDLGPSHLPRAQPQNSVRRTLTVARSLESNGSQDSGALDMSHWWHHIIPPGTALWSIKGLEEKMMSLKGRAVSVPAWILDSPPFISTLSPLWNSSCV